MERQSLSARSRIVITAIAIALAAFLSPTPAPASAAPCPAMLTVWGDANYHNPDGVAPHLFCADTNVPDLNDVAYSAYRLCPRAFPYPPVPGTGLKNTSWNDCISSMRFAANCHYRLRLYEDDDYGRTFRGPWIFQWGSMSAPRLSDFGANDQVSSIRFDFRPSCGRDNET